MMQAHLQHGSRSPRRAGTLFV